MERKMKVKDLERLLGNKKIVGISVDTTGSEDTVECLRRLELRTQDGASLVIGVELIVKANGLYDMPTVYPTIVLSKGKEG
jgi:hypothetical protein